MLGGKNVFAKIVRKKGKDVKERKGKGANPPSSRRNLVGAKVVKKSVFGGSFEKVHCSLKKTSEGGKGGQPTSREEKGAKGGQKTGAEKTLWGKASRWKKRGRSILN